MIVKEKLTGDNIGILTCFTGTDNKGSSLGLISKLWKILPPLTIGGRIFQSLEINPKEEPLLSVPVKHVRIPMLSPVSFSLTIIMLLFYSIPEPILVLSLMILNALLV